MYAFLRRIIAIFPKFQLVEEILLSIPPKKISQPEEIAAMVVF